MTFPPSHDPAQEQRKYVRALWRRATSVFGVAVLLAGYALLAVSPQTPSEWVLIRVTAGFGMLFVGFFMFILPWLTRILGENENERDN